MGLGGLPRFSAFIDAKSNSHQSQLASQQEPELFGRERLLGPRPQSTWLPLAARTPLEGLAMPSNSLSAREQFLGSNTSSLSLLAGLKAPKSAIHQAFKQCLVNIELDETRIQRASTHYNAIKNLLETRIRGAEVRRVGSFQKHTKIRPRTINGVASPIDIDAIVCLGDAYSLVSSGGLTGESCLQLVRSALVSNSRYLLMQPRIDHPVVTLSYASEFFIELVPCYRNKLDWESIMRETPSYLVAASDNHWEHADYDFDARFISRANAEADGKLIPAIKLIKQFCRNHEIQIKSFQVELLCLTVLMPFFNNHKEMNVSWEWQDLIAFFLQIAPSFITYDLSIPGSRTKAPPIETPYFTGPVLKYWGDQFAELCRLPVNNSTLQRFKNVYGNRFPSL